MFLQQSILQTPDKEKYLKAMLGQPEKPILIVVADEKQAEDNLELLRKILAAVQLNLDEDTQYCMITNQDAISFSELHRMANIRHCVLFGIDPKQLGLFFEIRKYHALHFQDTYFLCSDTLSHIAAQPQAKRALWEALKVFF